MTEITLRQKFNQPEMPSEDLPERMPNRTPEKECQAAVSLERAPKMPEDAQIEHQNGKKNANRIPKGTPRRHIERQKLRRSYAK